MQRVVVDFFQDELGDWTARLDCHHAQHVRHHPPLSERPWVLTHEGRKAHLGMALNCLRCDQLEFPEGLVAYKETPVFHAHTIPQGLLRDHSTKAGVWGQIQLSAGELRYLPVTGATQHLTPETPGFIPPQMKHRVEALGETSFKVIFFKAPPKKRVLIHAFEPFLNYRKNITAEILTALKQQIETVPLFQTLEIELRVLPVRFDAEIFLEPVQAFQPDFVLGLGQYPRGELIRIERKAFNQKRDKKADLDALIIPEGADSLRPNWRIQPNSRSRCNYDAGRYVCNFSMYTLTQAAQQKGFAYAFLHIPRAYPLQQGVNYLKSLLKAIERGAYDV